MSKHTTSYSPVLQQALGIDLRTLALFRIAIAGVVLIDLAMRATNLQAHYTDWGVLPRGALLDKFLDSPWFLSLHLVNGTTVVQAMLFLLAAVCTLSLMIGYRTQVASVASWFLLVSLQNRNLLIGNSGDVLLRVLLFWGMFLPLGARFSADNVLASKHHPPESATPDFSSDNSANASTHGNRNGPGWRLAAASQQHFSIATTAALLQVCFVYWFSAFLKDGGPWKEGSAIYYAFSYDQLVRPLGQMFFAYPNVMKQLTFATVGLEWAGPALALLPFFRGGIRFAMVVVFICFHVALALCLMLGIFPLACIAGWLLFLPGSFWEEISRRYAAASTSTQMRIERARTFLQRVSIALPGATKEPPATRRKAFAQTWCAQLIAGFFLFYVFCWNLRTTNYTEYSRLLPERFNWIADVTRVDQSWGMFAPFPATDDGWYVVSAQLYNGTEIDIFRGGAPLSWTKPPLVSAIYRNDRWQKYMEHLRREENAGHRIYFADYSRRRWNETHDADHQVKALQIYFMAEDTLPDYKISTPRKVQLASFKYAS